MGPSVHVLPEQPSTLPRARLLGDPGSGHLLPLPWRRCCPARPAPREPSYLRSHHKGGPLSESFPHHEGLLQGNGFCPPAKGGAPTANRRCRSSRCPRDVQMKAAPGMGRTGCSARSGGQVRQCHRVQTWGTPGGSHRMELRSAASPPPQPSTEPARAPGPPHPSLPGSSGVLDLPAVRDSASV